MNGIVHAFYRVYSASIQQWQFKPSLIVYMQALIEISVGCRQSAGEGLEWMLVKCQ